MEDHKHHRFRPTLSTLILIGLTGGIATGLFFGEMVSGLKLVGRAYIGLIYQLYDKWILGKFDTQKAPRWSVIRNVLHWIDRDQLSAPVVDSVPMRLF